MKKTILALLLLAACANPPAPVTTPPIAPGPPPPTPPPARSVNALTPVSAVSRTIVEPRIRVGLLSDLTTITFPRVDGGYYLIADAGAATLRRGFTMIAPMTDTTPHYGVQVSSVSDITSASALTDKLRSETGQRVDMLYDTAGTAYRIVAGDFASSAAAQPMRDQLTERGYGTGLMIVRRPSDQPFEKKHQLVDDEGERTTLDGESVLVMPATAETLVIGDKAYRTAARITINTRGLYNVINELNLEDYLRGVVPAEMGPKIYDELEALKAQTIAARTYAVRNLGQYRREGYDICAGPACQAYNGISAEDPMSDRAVRETAGLVITYQGQPIDALYTATCGGETSDVGTMFPGRSEPYLKRARCVEGEMLTIAGRADSGLLTEQQLNARIFAVLSGAPEGGATWAARDVEQAVAAAMHLLRFDTSNTVAPSLDAAAAAVASSTPRPVPHPLSSRRGDVLTYLASILGLERYASIVTMPEDRKYYFPQSSATESTPYLAAAFLIKFGFLPAQDIDRLDLNAAMPREELYGLLGSWLRKHNAITEATGKLLTISGRDVTLKAEGKPTRYTLPPGAPIVRRVSDRYQEYRNAPVMIGDRIYIQTDAQHRPLAVIINTYLDGASFDRTSSFASWTRTYRADELVASIKKRNPITQLLGLHPLTIDASQRIAEMEVTAEGGRTFVLRGLPVRWSLNVPDNLFVYEKTVDPDGMDRYTFYGKGWGHGIGFCQVGAYGMAFRGWTAQQILTHYYTGVEIGPMGTK